MSLVAITSMGGFAKTDLSSRVNIVSIDDVTFEILGVSANVPLSNAVLYVRNGDKPVNFSVDRLGRVEDDCGSFSRFNNQGSAVVIAEIQSQSRRTVGYRLLNCSTNSMVNMRVDDILKRVQMQEKPLLQNGIVRNNAVCCYPMKKFPVMRISAKVGMSISGKQGKKPDIKPSVPKQSQPAQVAVKPLNDLQTRELDAAKKHGVKLTKPLMNPDLQADQMRILWVSKKNGALSEYFADPRLSVDSMKFYADRIHSKSSAEKCAPLLERPDLPTDKLSELYLCLNDGLEIDDLMDRSTQDIYAAREAATRAYWGDSKYFDDPDYYSKALSAAMKLKGLA